MNELGLITFASNDRHEISRQQLAVSLFVNPISTLR